MSSEMIERVAKTLHVASCERRGVQPAWAGRKTSRSYYRRQARAAIEAMREPSDGMRRAGWATPARPMQDEVSDMWGAMIDAALKEPA